MTALNFSHTAVAFGAAFIAGAIGGLSLIPLNQIVMTWRSWGHGFAHGLTWGPALVVAAFLLTGTLHIGFMKLLIKPEEQEWWSRAGGFLLLLSVGWTALFALSIFVPWVFLVCRKWVKTQLALAGGWALSTAFGVIAGKSQKTSGKKDDGPSSVDLLAQVCPYIFIVGMLVLLSGGTFWLAKQNLEAREHRAQLTVVKIADAPRGQTRAKSIDEPREDIGDWSRVSRRTGCGWTAVCCSWVRSWWRTAWTSTFFR